MPFDDEIPTPIKQKGMKISNSSRSNNPPPKPSAETFQKQAGEANDRAIDFSKRAQELATRFVKMMEEKTLVQNKSVFAIDIEKETMTDLIKLGIEINNDETLPVDQPGGMGSIGLISMLFRSLIGLRDRVNNLEYSLNLANKKIILLESTTVDAKKGDE